MEDVYSKNSIDSEKVTEKLNKIHLLISIKKF